MNPHEAHDERAERSVIGAAFLDAGVVDVVQLDPRDFFNFRWRAVWKAILAALADGEPIDEVTVGRRLGDDGLGDIATAVMEVPTAANAAFYADIVKDYALVRRVLSAAGEIIQEFREQRHEGGDDLLSAALAKFSGLESSRSGGARTIGAIVAARTVQIGEDVDRRAAGEHVESAIPTGLGELDGYLGGGFAPGVLHLLVGRPAMGKSATLLHFADAGSEGGYGVHVFSLEDSERAYANRVISRRGRLRHDLVRTATLPLDDLHTLVQTSTAMTNRAGWLYHDRQSLRSARWTDIVRAVRAHRKGNGERGTELVLVDYAQIVDVQDRRRNQTTVDRLTEVINGLANAAAQDGIAYVVAAQLGRHVDARTDRRPLLADIKGSGAFEERAKVVIGMYRGCTYGPPVAGVDYLEGAQDEWNRKPTPDEWAERLDLILLKQNHGRTGVVRTTFEGDYVTVHDRLSLQHQGELPWADENY